MNTQALQTQPVTEEALRRRLASFLIDVAGLDGIEISSSGNLLWTAAKQLGARDIAQAATIAEAAWKRRAASTASDRVAEWGAILVAAETILENELARLDRAAPASGEEMA